jgi:hypothetical protein
MGAHAAKSSHAAKVSRISNTEFAEKSQAVFSVLSVRSVVDLFFAAREEVGH